MHRPEGWHKFLLAEVKKIPNPELLKGDWEKALLLFAEAGADAMYKALLSDKEMEKIPADTWDYAPNPQSVAKAQLKKVVEWAIEKRRDLTYKKLHQKKTNPDDIYSQIVLGVKIKTFQQVIDKCWQSILKEIE